MLKPPPPPAMFCSTNDFSESAPSFFQDGHSQSQPQARSLPITGLTPVATGMVPGSVVPPASVV